VTPLENMQPLGLIVAMSQNRCIGRDGGLPWQIPEDMKHFVNVTKGHAIIMGRKTHESIGKPLKNRRNIVVSRQGGLRIEGCEVAGSFGEALAMARKTDGMPIVIGGAAIYEVALPQVTRIWLTEVHLDVDGDAFFPPLVPGEWQEVDRREGDSPDVVFVTLERATGPGGSVPPTS